MKRTYIIVLKGIKKRLGVDLVKVRLSDKQFRELLKQDLYNGRPFMVADNYLEAQQYTL